MSSNLDEIWSHYLTRSFDLFGASLWQEWYGGQQIKDLVNTYLPDALFIEEYAGVARSYRNPQQLAVYLAKVKDLVKNDFSYCIKILEEGEALIKIRSSVLTNGLTGFENLEKAVNFLTEVGLKTAVFPRQFGQIINDLGLGNEVSNQLISTLRAVTYYPELIEKIITPLAQNALKSLGEDPNNLSFLTWKELQNGSVSQLKEREKAHQAGKSYRYEVRGEDEKITWLDDSSALITVIEGIDPTKIKSLKGQIAYLGIARGRAQVILDTTQLQNIAFSEGDILISINSNPDLMPFIQQAAALVTDEGGVTCHAAIISRELKKPCVIGTKMATKVFKNGDFVEVDANTGIVRKLEAQS